MNDQLLAALKDFLKHMESGDQVTIYRDDNTGDWHVIEYGTSYNLSELVEKP